MREPCQLQIQLLVGQSKESLAQQIRHVQHALRHIGEL
jgi:hypothetical protein